MEQVMCRSCGDFSTAVASDEGYVPIASACPACDGTSFEHTGTGHVVETG